MDEFSASELVSAVRTTWQSFRDFAQAIGADWLVWAAVVVGITIGLRLVRATLSGLFRARRQDAGKFRNLVANVFKSTGSLFLFVAALVVTAPLFVTLTDDQRGWLEAAFMIAAVIQVALWIRVVVRAIMEEVIARQAQDSSTFRSARNLITVFLNIAIFAVAGVMIIDNLGGDVTALLSGLGVGGIAIGLAAQSIFRDLFASLSIILDKPFEKGDFVRFGDYLGTVERIGLKTTHISALSGEQLVIGNDDLLSKTLQNFARMRERRVVVRFAVTYTTPRDVLSALPSEIISVVENTLGTRLDRCHVADYADSAIVLELVYFVLSADFNKHMDIKQSIQLAVHKLFEDRRVSFAFPTRTIVLEGSSESDTPPRSGLLRRQK